MSGLWLHLAIFMSHVTFNDHINYSIYLHGLCGPPLKPVGNGNWLAHTQSTWHLTPIASRFWRLFGRPSTVVCCIDNGTNTKFRNFAGVRCRSSDSGSGIQFISLGWGALVCSLSGEYEFLFFLPALFLIVSIVLWRFALHYACAAEISYSFTVSISLHDSGWRDDSQCMRMCVLTKVHVCECLHCIRCFPVTLLS